MRKNKCLMRFVKIIAFVICFVIIFAGIQKMFTSFYGEDGSHVEMFDSLQDNMDVLFLGSSQMFCTVNAQKLTEEYNICSCDWGANSQTLPITYYYLQEARKHIKPRLVAIEVSQFFQQGIPEEKTIKVCSWNYYNMPLSWEKYYSMKKVFNGRVKKSVDLLLFPLLESHSLWNQINPLTQAVRMMKKEDYSSRGFLRRDGTTPSKIVYFEKYDGPVSYGAEDEISAIYDIVNFCNENDTEVFFFKAPSDEWTRNESKAVKNFMDEHHYDYLEMNDYLDEMGINAATDFYNKEHLNTSGANKATDFLAKYLLENYRELLHIA